MLQEIARHFEVEAQYEITWSKQHFGDNLSRFYGLNLPKNSGKQEHCGTGPFLCVIVKDLKPEYKVHETSKGPQRVNTRMFRTKTALGK